MNLVVQGGEVSPDELARLAALTGAAGMVDLGPQAWRLVDAGDHPSIAPFCTRRRLDFAWIPDGRRLCDMRLVALDMDSTLITIECIDEIGDLFGIRDQVAT